MKMDLRGKKVTVVGLARSGVGAANILAGMGAEVTVTDRQPEAKLAEAVRGLAPSVRRVLGGHPGELFMSADLIVVSPGVPLEMGQILSAEAKGIPVIGELELAYQIMETVKRREQRAKGEEIPQRAKREDKIPFLAVTGSNGKSTTTTLLDFMLRKGGFKTLLGGNIGNALTEEILKTVKGEALNVKGEEHGVSPLTFNFSQDYLVVEVSSFQLDSIDRFRPRIAAILNITPDHLDRYHSLAEYGSSKARIFENQNAGDFIVLNADDPEIEKVENQRLRGKTGGPDVLYFSRRKKVKGMYCKDGDIYCDIPSLSCLPDHPFIAAAEIGIKGVHNLENAMAASAMALLAGCPRRAVIESLKEFDGLEHRLEFVRELDGVRYVNDSKGTNVGAVMKSIESFNDPVVLIAGGRDKAGDFSALRDLVSRKVRALVLIGEAAAKIKNALGDVTDTVMAGDLKDAVAICREKAVKGDVVLLSPACASFDMFSDFEDRGRQFKQMVKELGR
jgi:UDP-N-acetylmuramoylalanine--D-glutamate ligase